MTTISLALCLAVSASAGVSLNSHPLIGLMSASAPLRHGVAHELKTLAANPRDLEAASPAKTMALSLIAHRDELPAGTASELLGPEAARALSSVSLDADALEDARAQLDAHDPESMERFAKSMRHLFDNQNTLWPGESLVVSGKKSSGAPALAPSTEFLFDSVVTPRAGEGLGPDVVIERGVVRGMPAKRLRFPDGSTLTAVETAGNATSWDQARSKAKALGEGWDLPTEREYFPLIMSTALDLRLVVNQTRDERAIYPMWLRADDEKKNAELSGTALLLTAQDGAGMDITAVDAGPAAVSEYGKQLALILADLAAGNHRTQAEERRLSEALKAVKGWLNPNVTHEELPDDVNAIIRKPSKQTLENGAAILKRLIAAFESGYPVYSVSTTPAKRHP